MSVARWNIEVDQRATLSEVHTWYDANNQLVDLTGYSALMEVRTDPASAAVVFSASTANGRVLLGGTAGTVELNVPASVTQGLDPEVSYVYDLTLTSSAGDVTRLLDGVLTVSVAVTAV